MIAVTAGTIVPLKFCDEYPEGDKMYNIDEKVELEALQIHYVRGSETDVKSNTNVPLVGGSCKCP